MTKPDEYTQDEVREILELLGVDLRSGEMSEAEFRKQAAKYGLNATEIDQLVKEALKPT